MASQSCGYATNKDGQPAFFRERYRRLRNHHRIMATTSLRPLATEIPKMMERPVMIALNCRFVVLFMMGMFSE